MWTAIIIIVLVLLFIVGGMMVLLKSKDFKIPKGFENSKNGDPSKSGFDDEDDDNSGF